MAQLVVFRKRIAAIYNVGRDVSILIRELNNLNVSPKPKITSSTCLYDVRLLPSAVIGSFLIHHVNAEYDEVEDGL